MQHGCMERLTRKRGPEVWQFRWSVNGADGKRLYHKIPTTTLNFNGLSAPTTGECTKSSA